MNEKIKLKVSEKLREDYKDIQMGLGQTYFEKLVDFIIKEAKKDE